MEESRIKNWEFLKHWDRSLRQRIKDGRLPTFDPVSFGSQYVHFQREWSEEPKNKNKSLDIWVPSSSISPSLGTPGNRPSKRQRQQQQRQQQAAKATAKTPAVASANGGNPNSNIICRNFAANGTCKFNPCKFKH